MSEDAPLDGQFDIGSGRLVGLAEYGDPNGWPVLAIHGAPASRLVYAPADAPARALGLRIIAPDRPGYGLTPSAPGRTLASTTDLHEAIVDAFGLDRLAVIGISGGAPFAVALAARLGARVSAMALVSPLGPIAEMPPASEPGGPKALFDRLPRSPFLLRTYASTVSAAFRRAPHALTKTFGAALGAPDKHTLAREPAASNLPAMTLEAVRDGVDGALQDMAIYLAPWQVDMSRIVAPTVLWQGNSDPMVPQRASTELARRLPGCVLRAVKGGGHFWVYDNAGEVLSTLSDLIARDRQG